MTVPGAATSSAARPARPAPAAAAPSTPAGEAAAALASRGAVPRAAAPAALDPVWSVHQSRSTGLLYFFHRLSGVTQWEEPASFDGRYEPWAVDTALRMAAATGKDPSPALLAAAASLEGAAATAAAPATAARQPPAAAEQRPRPEVVSAPASNGHAAGRPLIPARGRYGGRRRDDDDDDAGDDDGTGSIAAEAVTWAEAARAVASPAADLVDAADDPGASPGRPGRARKVVASVPLVDLRHLGPDAGWRQHVTDDGLVYYSNGETGATTWERPECLGPLVLEEEGDVMVLVGGSGEEAEAKADHAADDAGRDQDGGGGDFPELHHETFRGKNGWLSTTDDDGYVYYVHEPTQRTQWERPDDFA